MVPHPDWFFTDNLKESLDVLRNRLTNPSKLTVAIELDGLWWRARVEKVDRRAHFVSWGGEGGEWSPVRLIDNPGAKGVRRFVFLVQRNGMDPAVGMNSFLSEISM